MSGDTRKLHYKQIRDFADEHVGHKGDIWYDPTTTTLRFYSGDAGGTPLAVGGYSSSQLVDYGSGNTAQNVAIDLTKRYHWICNLVNNSYHYTLADGAEGQVLEFYASAGLLGNDRSYVWIDHVYCWNGSSSYVNTDRYVSIFDANDVNQLRTKTTATFLNGGWHFDHHVLELGPIP